MTNSHPVTALYNDTDMLFIEQNHQTNPNIIKSKTANIVYVYNMVVTEIL